MDSIVKQINSTWYRIFSNPYPVYTYDDLVFRKKVLAWNTYRWFHKVNKSLPWAKEVFERVLKEQKIFIIKSLNNANSETDIDILEIYICKILKEELSKNIRQSQLESFNKIRKPIDIVIEHLVTMCNEFNSKRMELINYLYLPLDSQIFQSPLTFSDENIQNLSIKRTFTFKDITDSNHYYEIQEFLKNKAIKIGLNNRISFDLIWWDRYKKEITNLFANSEK